MSLPNKSRGITIGINRSSGQTGSPTTQFSFNLSPNKEISSFIESPRLISTNNNNNNNINININNSVNSNNDSNDRSSPSIITTESDEDNNNSGSNNSFVKVKSNTEDLYFNEDMDDDDIKLNYDILKLDNEINGSSRDSSDTLSSLDTPTMNFLSSSQTSLKSSNHSINSNTNINSINDNSIPTPSIQTNYNELHQEMFITKLKDKIIIIPMKPGTTIPQRPIPINLNQSNPNLNTTPTYSSSSTNNNNNNSSSSVTHNKNINLKASLDTTQFSAQLSYSIQEEECLVIDRNTCNLSKQVMDVSPLLASASNGDKKNNHKAHGIVGIISLLSGNYLVTIGTKSLVGIMNEKRIYRIENCNLILIPHEKELSETEKKMETAYKKSLKSLLKYNFYFSYDLDISNSLQRNSILINNLKESNLSTIPLLNLYETFDPRFYWNKNMQSMLISKQLNHWILPLIRGYVEIFNFFLESSSFEFALISRRSINRAGTRYNTRGSDLFGNVANYVETEQIIYSTCLTGRKTFSFIQTRGSIPLIWEQSGRKIKPEIKISPDQSINKTSFKLHFDSQIKYYGKQTIVTLLDQKGSEATLNEAYRSTLNSLEYTEVDLVAFDFHHFCQGGRFDRVDILMDNLEEKIENIGFMERDDQNQSYQEGILRTNCLDCLDRTNLVQSMIGTTAISNQLKKLGFQWTIKDPGPLSKQIKLAWANNGDAISFQYAGTNALKGDFTRTGKRNTKGVVKDGVNSITRYYINNFLDKIRQVSIDLFLGIIQVETNTYSIIQKEYDWGESRMDAINNCVDHYFKSEKEDDQQNGFINAWIVISINKRNQEQERILLLTKTHLVRCKYNFNENKIVHFKKQSLSTLKRIQIGDIKLDKKLSFGLKLYFSDQKESSSSNNNNNNSSASKRKQSSSQKIINTNTSNNNNIDDNNNDDNDLYNGNLYIVPIPDGETIEFGKDLANEIVDIIKEGFLNLLGYANIGQLSFGQNFISEKSFKRKTNSLVVSAYNGLRLGFYSKSPSTTSNKNSLSNKPNTMFLNNSNNSNNNNNNNSNSNTLVNQNRSSTLIDKRRSKSFDASEFTIKKYDPNN